jgi:hypothetical protein
MLWNPQRGSTATTIDSFEDGDIAEYSGDTGSFTTTNESTLSWGAPDGSIVLENPTGSGFNRIVSTSGLNEYFPKGNTAECAVRTKASGPRARVLFGVGGAYDYYFAEVDWLEDRIRLGERVSGSLSHFATDATFTPSVDTTATVRITWDDGTLGGSDNDITMQYFEGGTQVGSDLTTNDPSHATNDGIGFVGAANDDPDEDLYWDNYRLTT